MEYWGRLLRQNPDRKNSEEFSTLLFQSHLYSFALISQTHATSYSFFRKPDRKPQPLPYGWRNPCRNLMSENSQDYAQKPKRKCTFMNSASGRMTITAGANKAAFPSNRYTHNVYILCIHRVNRPRLILLVYGVQFAGWGWGVRGGSTAGPFLTDILTGD